MHPSDRGELANGARARASAHIAWPKFRARIRIRPIAHTPTRANVLCAPAQQHIEEVKCTVATIIVLHRTHAHKLLIWQVACSARMTTRMTSSRRRRRLIRLLAVHRDLRRASAIPYAGRGWFIHYPLVRGVANTRTHKHTQVDLSSVVCARRHRVKVSILEEQLERMAFSDYTV